MSRTVNLSSYFFFFQAEDGIRDKLVTGVQTCALPISDRGNGRDELLSGWLRKKEPSGLLGSLGCVVVRESTQVLNPPDGVGIFTFAITRSTNPNSGANRVSCASSRSSLRSRSPVCRHSAHCARRPSRAAGRRP